MAINQIKKEKSAEAICRLCCEEREQYQLIFIHDDDFSSLGEWIQRLTTLKVTKIPNAPAALCSECESTLRNFESFREMCFTNDRMLQKMFPPDSPRNDCKANDNMPAAVSELEADQSESQESGHSKTSQMSNAEVSIEYPNIKTENTSSPYPEEENDESESISEPEELPEDDYPEGSAAEREKSHICSFCNKGFKNSNRLDIHIRSHTQERPHKCEDCDKSFITSSSLKRHSITHSGLKPYSCDRCPAKYNQSSHLVRHQTVHQTEDYIKHKHYLEVLESGHEDSAVGHAQEYGEDESALEEPASENGTLDCSGVKDKRKLCTICNKRVYRLTQHLFVHNQIRPYKCDICAMGFTQMYKLTIHKRKHTKEKPFACSHCEKAFTCTADLKVHIRSHTQERRFPCKLCDKAFITSGHLLRHTQTHSGLKPFPCDLCPANFAQKCHLERHKKVHEKLMCPRMPGQELLP